MMVSNESQQPTCQNCATSTTPLWRRDEIGSVLCNACGLFLKLHGRPRPISLKTDVIKSRNRVKSTHQGSAIKKKVCRRLLKGRWLQSELIRGYRVYMTPMASTKYDRKLGHRLPTCNNERRRRNLPTVYQMVLGHQYRGQPHPRCMAWDQLSMVTSWTTITITMAPCLPCTTRDNLRRGDLPHR